ncbi:MAG: hypothetical protein LQ338_007065, partial [Usnochroma carphineum]
MSAPGPTSLIYQENTIESPSPNGQPIEKTLVAASAPRVTAFPPLTGRRTTASGGSITIRTFESKISLPDLQEAARRHNASLAAIPQLAWAKLLQAYTGSKDGVVFHSILPSGRDEYTTDLASQITSVPNALVQEEDVAIGRVLCQLSEDVLRSTHRQNTIQNPDEVEKTEQQKGTLLGLGHLTEYVRGCRTLDDQCHRRPRYSAALCLELFGSTAGFLSLTVSGWSSLIDNDAAQLLLAHFEQTLEVVLTCPDKTFGEAFTHYPAPLMSVSNVKPTVPATFSSLQCQFEDTAESEPQRVALEFWTDRGSQLLQPDTVWTYSELDEKAGTLAAHLQDYFGSLIGHIVPICMDRCPETYVAVLAILKVGGAWCPIDPSFPTLRRHDLIARTGAKALIVNAQSPQGGIPQDVIAVDMSRIDWSSPKQFKRMTVASDSLAYLIWTSGTTGAPKGVPICHHAAASSMRALQACIPTDVKQGNVRCLQFSQFTFDVFIQDLFFTWGVGGTLISADRATMLGSFSGLSTKAAATHAHLTPAFAASLPRKYCPTLEVVTMIGEKLTQSVADDWSKDCQLYNTYGPAEATVVSTFRLVPYGDKMQSANVGLPLPSVSAFVIHNGGLVLKHGIGELALGGPQLSKGYWKDTTRTKERFVWNEHLQTTLYMTGDIVRQLHDGTFEFVGRTDDLIKIQGIRVELSEIAFALRSCHPQVRQVEVSFLKRVDRPSKVIVAFLAAPTLASYNRGIIEDEGGVEVARKALEVAKAQLPEYMIPKVFLVVDSISRTSSAKVDRAAMEQLYANVNLGPWEKKLGSTGSEGEAADLSPRELVIMGLISELT